MAVDGGYRDWVAQSQIIKFIEIRVHCPYRIHFIDRQDNGLAASQQHGRHLLVRSGKARADICEKHNYIRVAHGNPSLFPHECQDFTIRPRLDAAGVDQGKFPSVPVGFAVDTVPRHAGGILYDGNAPANQLVEQRGFPDVRTAYNSYNRL